jgi:hypothetical protein
VKYLKPLFAVLCSVFLFHATPEAAPVSPAAVSSLPVEVNPPAVQKIKAKDIRKILGRKLTLKEKMIFWLLKNKLKKEGDEKSKKGMTSFVFGIVGIACLLAGIFLPYFLIAAFIAGLVAVVVGSVARKKNPDDGKAIAGRLLGWITLAGIGVLLILAAIVVIAWASWWD